MARYCMVLGCSYCLDDSDSICIALFARRQTPKIDITDSFDKIRKGIKGWKR